MKETLRALYNQEVERARLDFDGDRDYQAYYTQSQALWKEGDMPEPFFHLLDASNYLAFSHGFRLGMLEAFSLPGGRGFRRPGGIVVAKSTALATPLRELLATFPCSSSPNRTRCAGLRFGGGLRPPLGRNPGIRRRSTGPRGRAGKG